MAPPLPGTFWNDYDALEAQVDAAKGKSNVGVPPPPLPHPGSGYERHYSHYSRSRSRERRSRTRSLSRDRYRGRSRSRSRDRDRYSSRRRERTPEDVRMQREREKELKELERLSRTVLVLNLNLRADERDLFEAFSRAGRVQDIRLITDKNTRRSRGIAYVEMQNAGEALQALQLNGTPIMSQPIIVRPSEAEKNMAWEAQQEAKRAQAAAAAALGPSNPGAGHGGHRVPLKLQILNLHPDITDQDLKDLFTPFGPVTYVTITRHPTTNAPTGEAFVQFADKPHADAAIKHYNGLELAGNRLTVQVAPVITVPGAAAALAPLLAAAPGAAAAAAAPTSAAQAPPDAAAAAAAGATAGVVDDLQESEGEGGLRLNARSRVELMAKLASSAGLPAPLLPAAANPLLAPPAAQHHPSVPPVAADQGALGPASPIPTPCLLLMNMFGPDDVASGTVGEVEEDVREEAGKCGQLLHIHADAGSSKGCVYLKFGSTAAAETAVRALHGRFYSGRQVVAQYQFTAVYNTHFGLKP